MFEDYYKFLGEARSACRNRTVYKETDAMEQNRQAAQNNPEPEFAAFVAIDWADQKHYWSLREAGSKRIERGEVENTPEAMEVWAAQWSARFEGRPIAVALEQRRGAVVAMLSKYEQLHLYPVHPLTLANYRQAFYPSRNKNDVLDADLLLELLCEHRDRLRRLDPDTAEMRLLQFQVENRRKLVDERTAVSNRLTDLLKMLFPADRAVVRRREFGACGRSAVAMADPGGAAKGQAQDAGKILSATPWRRPGEDAAADGADSDGDSCHPRRGLASLLTRPGQGVRAAACGVAGSRPGLGEGDRAARPPPG
jgi:hypothetical protein